MSGPEVRDTMGAGPTKLTAAGSAGYSSWYWGNDFCVLFHGGKVVGKDRATTATSATLGPGQYAEKRPAQCLAPGEVSQSTVERSVTIPGVGSAKLPSDLRPSDQIGGPTNPSPNGPEPGEAGGTVTQ